MFRLFFLIYLISKLDFRSHSNQSRGKSAPTNSLLRYFKSLPHLVPRGVGVTKSRTITFLSYLAASWKINY